MRPDIIVGHHAARCGGAAGTEDRLFRDQRRRRLPSASDPGAARCPHMRRAKGRIAGLVVAIRGDVVAQPGCPFQHRRAQHAGRPRPVDRPSTLPPPQPEQFGAEVFTSMTDGLDGADVVMMLRMQRERMNGSFVPAARILPLLRPRRGEAVAGQARRTRHASRSDEPRRRDRVDRGRWRAQRDPRAGRDGRGSAWRCSRRSPVICRTVEAPHGQCPQQHADRSPHRVPQRPPDRSGNGPRRAGRCAGRRRCDHRHRGPSAPPQRASGARIVDCKGHALLPA